MYSLRDVTDCAQASNCKPALFVGNLRNDNDVRYSSEDLNYRVLPQLPEATMNQASRYSLPCTGSAPIGSSSPTNCSYFCSNVGSTMQPLLNRLSAYGLSEQPLSRCSVSRSTCEPTTPWFNSDTSTANHVQRLSIHDDTMRFTQLLPVTACHATRCTQPFDHYWTNSGSGHQTRTTAPAQPANTGMTSYNVLGNITNSQMPMVNRTTGKSKLMKSDVILPAHQLSSGIAQGAKDHVTLYTPSRISNCSAREVQCRGPQLPPVLPTCSFTNRSPPLFDAETVAILTSWYENHREHPYPDAQEATQMSRDGNISVVQLRRWFANRRRRNANTKHVREIALRRRQR